MSSRPNKETGGAGPRLATKLYLPPARQTLVARPRLLAQLAEGLKGKLTLISAPAGFGKTSLVTAWRQQSDAPLAWLSLDEEDNEPTRFLDYLLAALQVVDPALAQETSSLLHAAAAPPLKAVMSSLLYDITEGGVEFVLALDDYHVIREQGIHEALGFLIERLPPHAHLLIASRSDPPFPLARLRARGELTEIRASDLRFDEREAAAFLNGVMSLGLTADEVAALEERTEGWVAGLQLSALSLQGRENKSELVREFAGDHRFILDYLLEEVLNRQPVEVQDFLLRTSVLYRLSGPLSDALTGHADGHEILQHLNRSNLFLIPLDSKGNWFRYHHLFADLLRLKLRQEQPGVIRALQIKASVWCEENELVEEAINYALAARDWERALDLIEPIGYKLLSLGKFERLKNWVEPIPEAVLRKRPMLCYWYVPTLLYNDELDKAEKYLQIIETAEPEELRRSLIAEVWTSRSLMAAVCGDVDQAEEFSRKAFDSLVPDDATQHAAAHHTRVCCARLRGDMKATERTVLEALPFYQRAEHYLFETWAKTYLASARAMQGHLREGAEALEDVIRYAAEHIPNRPEPFIYPHSALCDIYREWGDIEAAKTHLDEALTYVHQTGRGNFMVLVPDSLKSLSLMLELSGERARSQELIENASKRARKHGNEIVPRQLRALLALLDLRRGDLSAAGRWAESSGLTPDDEPTYRSELEHLTLARWLVARGEAERALPLLARLRRLAEEGSRRRVVIEVLILQSLARGDGGDEAGALETLEEALRLAGPENFVRSFTDEGEPLSGLLLRALKQNGKRWEAESPELLRHVLKLNEAFGPIAPVKKAQAARAEDLPWWYAKDPLSERELEVLRHVSQGSSNQEIADKLFLSAGTVKRHMSNIYQKLDVHSRTQAVDRARTFRIMN